MSTYNNTSLDGTYLYFNNNKLKFIRSGKATGQTLEKWNSQHQQSAEQQPSTTTNFHRLYPAQSTKIPKESRDGWWEDLKQLVAFAVTSDQVVAIMKDVDEGGLFLLPNSVKTKISNVNFCGATNLETKTKHMIGYCAELAYQLCLAPRDDTSSNAGFKTPIGLFTNQQGN